MPTPIEPTGSHPKSNYPIGGGGEMPPGPILPVTDPWVKALAILFPHVNIGELQMYASRFRDNMFSAINNEISRDKKKMQEAAKRLKDAIEGKD